MTPTATKPTAFVHSSVRQEWIALAISWLAALMIGVVVLAGPRRVEHITIVNPTSYRLTITASTPGSSSYTQVGIIGPSTTRTFDNVIDRGQVWVLDLQAQGAHAGSIRVSRDVLTGTTPFTIPFDINQQLQDDGIVADIPAES